MSRLSSRLYGWLVTVIALSLVLGPLCTPARVSALPHEPQRADETALQDTLSLGVSEDEGTASQEISLQDGPITLVLRADPGQIAADGVSEASIWVLARYGDKQPVPDGTEVVAETTTGHVIEEATTVDGLARLVLTAGREEGTAVVTVGAGGVRSSVSVDLVSPGAAGTRISHLVRPPFDLVREIESVRHPVTGDREGVVTAEGESYVARVEGGHLAFVLKADAEEGEAEIGLVFALTGVRVGDSAFLADGTEFGTAVIAEENRATIRRSVDLEEQYEALDGGIKQSFVLHRPVQEDLIIDGAFEITPSDLTPVHLSDEEGIVFLNEQGHVVLAYTGVIVQDAAGREALAQMSIDGAQVQITVPGRWLAEAEYPVVVDPLIGDPLEVSSYAIEFRALDVAYNPVAEEWLVVWSDQRNGDWDVFGQRLTDAGVLTGTTFQISDSSASGDQLRARVAVDAAGYYVVVWEDSRNESQKDIYGQVISSSGTLSGTNFAVVTTASTIDSDVAIAYGSEQDAYLVTSRRGYDVYGQMVHANGTLSGTQFALSTAGMTQGYPVPAYDASRDRFLVVWQDPRGPNASDVYGYFVSGSGVTVDSEFTVCTASGNQYVPRVAYHSGSDLYLVAWKDRRDGNYDMYGQWIEGSGTFSGTEITIAVANYDQKDPATVALPRSGGFLVAWKDYRDNGWQSDIYLQRYDEEGAAIGGNEDLVGPVSSSSAVMARHATRSEAMLAWQSTGQDVYVQVYAIVDAHFTATPLTGTAPLTVTFENLSTPITGTRTYTWTFGDGSTSSLENPTHCYTTTGSYTVSLTIEALTQTHTVTRTNYITVTSGVTPTPVAAFTASPVSGTSPLSVTFTNSSTDATSYVWDYGNGITSTVSAATHVYTYTLTGVYTVSLAASGAGGTDVLTRTGYITVTDDVTAPVAAFTASPVSGNAPLAVTYTNSSTNATGYVWDYGNGVTSTTSAVMHVYTYTTAGVYTVTLTATGAGGSDILTRTHYISVSDSTPPPPPPNASFSATPLSGNAPLTVTFDNNSAYATSYGWAFGDGSTSTTESPVHVYTAGGTYTVTLTVTGTGGSDVLVREAYISVVEIDDPPVVTVTSPIEGQVFGASGGSANVSVAGIVADDGTVVSVLVNGTAATLNGGAFNATVSLGSGNRTIDVVAEDDAGQMAFASVQVGVDGEGPMIEIHAPKTRQAVYTTTPSIVISYTDFYSTVNTGSLSVQLADEDGNQTAVTNDLTVTATGAWGAVSTPLTDDVSYTLTVSLADAAGNTEVATATFLVPYDVQSIVPPDEPDGAGWVSGVVYDTYSCSDDYLRTCEGLPGASVTLAYSGGQTISGTVVTGPDGFFAFPVPETGYYWLRVEREDYTYGQRVVRVVREHSTATTEIYLTPIDGPPSACTSAGCTHDNWDESIQVVIPAGAIEAGETVTVTATLFEHVEFLPSGELPPGTWETYAFNLGGDSEVEFTVPITVYVENSLAFSPGISIPLGYWNQSTYQWEHAGTGVVDETGDWVVMTMTHFSNYDCNSPVSYSDAGATSTTRTETSNTCPASEPGCTIEVKSGILKDEYALPPVRVLEGTGAPTLLYNSRRASPSEVIDLELSVDPGVGAELGDWVGFELFVEGIKTDDFVFSSTLAAGEVGRFRYLWDGRDVQGNRMPPGVYEYEVRFTVPYTAEYCYSLGGIFGNPRDCENGATGNYVEATEDVRTYGTVELDTQIENELGTGWVLGGLQRLYADQVGHVLIADGERTDEFYSPHNDLLTDTQELMLVWVDEVDDTLSTLPLGLARNWLDAVTVTVGSEPVDIALPSDSIYAYVVNRDSDSVSVVNVVSGTEVVTISVGSGPERIAIAEGRNLAYVTNRYGNSISVIDLVSRSVTHTIVLGENDGGSDIEPSGIALSPDEEKAYVLDIEDSYDGDRIYVLSLDTLTVTQVLTGTMWSNDIAISPVVSEAYVISDYPSQAIYVIDLVTGEEKLSRRIGTGNMPWRIVLSSDGDLAYTISQYTGYGHIQASDIFSSTGNWETVWAVPTDIALSADESRVYVTGQGSGAEGQIDVFELGSSLAITWLETIDAGSAPSAIALLTDMDGSGMAGYCRSNTDTDHSILTYDALSGTYLRTYPDGTEVHFDTNGRHDYTLAPDGRKTVYSYNADDTVATMGIVPPGETTADWTWTFSYQAGKLSTVSDPAGRVTTFTVDAHNHLTQIEGPDGSTRGYAYNQEGLITQFTDENGAVAEYTYDGYGRLSGVAEPLRASYDPDTGETAYIRETRAFTTSDTGYALINDSVVGDPDDPAPSVPKSADLVDEVQYGRGGRSGHTNEWGVWLDETDALSRTKTFGRDGDNNLTQLTMPAGNCVEATYDRNGNPLTLAQMGSTQCALASAQRDASQVATATLTYESRFNQIKTVTDALGRTTTYHYDYELDLGEAGKLVRIAYPQVRDETGTMVTPTVVYTYNTWGLLSQERDLRGTVTCYTYTQGTASEASGGATPLFATGVTPVPGLLTRVVRDCGDTSHFNLTTTYKDFDASGNAMTVVRPGSDDVTRYAYDARGRTISETNSVGIVTTYAYDGRGNLARTVVDWTADGTTGRNLVTEYAYDGQGRLVGEETTGDGFAAGTAYQYDVNGKLAHREDTTGNPDAYVYDDADQLTNRIDAAGQVVTYTYDQNGRQETVTDAQGIVTRNEYDGWDRLVRTVSNWQDGVYDADEPDADVQTRYQYDKLGNTVIVTDTLGHMSRTFYDDGDRVLGRIGNWDGTMALDGCATLPAVRDKNICTRYAYDEAGNTVIVTDTLGRMTRTFYDALGRVEATVSNWNPAALSVPADCVLSAANESVENVCTLYGYDAAGNQVTTTNALNQTALTVYDAKNRPIVHVANWDGTAIDEAADCTFPPSQPDVNVCTVTEYNSRGQRSATKDPLGNRTEYGYDDRGRLITTTRTLDGSPVTTVSHYDALGNRTAETDARGHTTSYVYDELNRLVKTVTPEGVTTAQVYDALGRVVTTTDGLGNATVTAYDDLGRRASVTDPEGNVTRYVYDGMGHQVAITNANDVQTSYVYDELGRQVAVVENDTGGTQTSNSNVRTEYLYDALGQRIVITNARGYSSTFTTYDALGRAVVVEDALGHRTTTQYNALGYRTVVTDADGAVTQYSYDGLNRLTGIYYVDEDRTVSYAYDTVGNRVAMTDSVGVTSYVHNDLYRLVGVDDPVTGTVTYTYDVAGNRTHIVYSSGQTVTYTYDADNRLARVEDWDSGTTTYAYDGAGRAVTTTMPNHVTTVDTFDDAGRLVRHTHTAATQAVLADYQYTLDGLGNRTGTTETLTATRAITQVYDGLNRLSSSAYSTGESFAYTYDAVGNRAVVTSVTPVSGTVVTTYTFDAANRLTDRAVSDGRTYTYTWSNRGQMTVEWTNGYAVRTFSYNDAGHMTEATVFTLTTRFTYNGDGARLKVEVVGQGTTTYTVDYAGGYRVLAEEKITGTLVYLYGLECMGQYDDDGWLYYLGDATGYVRQGTNNQGIVISAWLFNPDGLVLEGPEGPVSHLMCKGVYDWSTGLIHKDQRYFDPMLGIWLALAPLAVIQSWRGRKRKKRWWTPWYVVLICVMGVSGMLVGCRSTDVPTNTPTATATATATCTNTYTPAPTMTNTPTDTPTTVPTGTPKSTPTGTPTSTPTGTPTHTPTPTDTPAPMVGEITDREMRKEIVRREVERLIPAQYGKTPERILLLAIATLESEREFDNSDKNLQGRGRTMGGIMQVTGSNPDPTCKPNVEPPPYTFTNTEVSIQKNVYCGVHHFYKQSLALAGVPDRLNTEIREKVQEISAEDRTWRVVAAAQWYTGCDGNPNKMAYLFRMAQIIQDEIPTEFGGYSDAWGWVEVLEAGHHAREAVPPCKL